MAELRFRNHTLPFIRRFIHFCGCACPVSGRTEHLFHRWLHEIDQKFSSVESLLESTLLINVCLSCWSKTTIMSLGAKITGLDLGPVIICCQIFLSMKWNNSMISANLCPPFTIMCPNIYVMQMNITLLFIKSLRILSTALFNVWLLLVFHCLCHLRFSHYLDKEGG